MVVVGCLRERRQEGGFPEGQFVERAIEIIERRGGDAVGAETKVDFVEIEFENSLLGQRPLDTERENRFLDLALDGDLVTQQEVLRDLLGDGRAADGPALLAVAADVGEGSAQDAERVDAWMLEEVLVLGRQEGADQLLGHGRNRHEHALLDRVLGEQPSVSGVHPGHRRRLVARELLVVRQGASELVEHIKGATARRQ